MNTVGIDIGGTKTLAVSIAPDGTVGPSVVLPTPPEPAGVVDTATRAVRTLAKAHGCDVADFAAVGIGVPGRVDRKSGEVRNAVNLGVTRLALGSELRHRLRIPVYVDNDVTAAAMGAAHLMGAKQNMAFLNLGTGLAAGIIVDGRPWRGQVGVAGEIGHLPVDPQGIACPCGQRGCLETIASGSALRRVWPEGGEHPGRHLLSAIASGDEVAREAFDRLAEGAASCVRILTLSVDPQRIVIGGGLSRLGDPLLDAVRTVLGRWAADSPFIADLRIPPRVQLLPPDLPAAAVGAALVAEQRD